MRKKRSIIIKKIDPNILANKRRFIIDQNKSSKHDHNQIKEENQATKNNVQTNKEKNQSNKRKHLVSLVSSREKRDRKYKGNV